MPYKPNDLLNRHFESHGHDLIHKVEEQLNLVSPNSPNLPIYRDMIPQTAAAAPEAVILIVTDPPDPLADLARRLAGHDRVLSTGTWAVRPMTSGVSNTCTISIQA